MIQLGLLTVLTLIAFAGNSILNRMALAEALISPEAFAAIRLTSGALALGLMVSLRQRSARWLRKGSATRTNTRTKSQQQGLVFHLSTLKSKTAESTFL